MTNDDKDSLEEMLAKIPITETRGSLLSAIGNLLRVIDISESSIMIPTLLKDKCEFDAYEMLTLAKILKASILGHEDLVKFYMHEPSNLQFDLLLAQQQHHQQQLQLQSTTPSLKSSSESTSSSPQSTPRAETIALIGNRNRNRNSNSNSNSNNSNSNSNNSNNSIVANNNDRLQFNERAPVATISLLMQVEQLKKFIPQVTGLFESIIELYKNSVECVTPNRTL